jgi:hypothetical protein
LIGGLNVASVRVHGHPRVLCTPHGSAWRVSILVLKHQGEHEMSRLTITLSDARHKALKEAAAERGKTIGQLLEESLDFYGIKPREDARELVARARARNQFSEDQALVIANEEVRAVRHGT